jgi:uncharacterized protein (DUF1778 family)
MQESFVRASSRPKTLTASITAKVTPEEEALFREQAKAAGVSQSEWSRQVMIEAASSRPASEILLALFIETMEASLELGDGFTLEKFREMCAELAENG